MGFLKRKVFFCIYLKGWGLRCKNTGAPGRRGSFVRTIQLTDIYGRQPLDLDRTVRTLSGIWIVYLRSEVRDPIWNLDRPFTIGCSGPDLESGNFLDHGVSGCAHKGTWRLRTSTRVGSRVRACVSTTSLWTRGSTWPATLWGSGSGGRCPQPSGGAFYLW